jgi:hypothetical protein
MSNEQQAKGSSGSQMRYTEAEISIIKSTFKGNEDLLRLMRKVFLPELDPAAPLGQQIDLWMTVKIDDVLPEQAIINLKARNQLITHIDQMLLSLKMLAETADETPEEAVTRLKKDSSK